MRNLLLTLAFCGTNYHGFQVQKNAHTVCAEFQNALERVFNERPDVKGCSRTDAGVHANEYAISFRISHTISCARLVAALNRALPDDIAVTSAREVPQDFHARYSCKAKRYIYRILNSNVKDPFSPNLSYRLGYPLDVELLAREARDFVGTHDFAAFCSSKNDLENTVRTISSFGVERLGDIVLFTVTGDGFLYNMVRIMVGTLVFIACGKLEPGCIPRILASKDRCMAGKTMPAHGLFLDKVYYDDERSSNNADDKLNQAGR